MIHPHNEKASALDPMDSKWQADPNFKPDKRSEWDHPMEEDGWMHAHNSLRGEIKDIALSLSSISEKFPGKTPDWAVQAIKEVWSGHQTHVHGHHKNEDEIMTPFLKERINLPDKLESDHVEIVNLIHNVTDAVDALEEGSGLDRVILSFDHYKEALLPHLLEEEEVALPLVYAYFTPKEYEVPVQNIMSNGNAFELGSFVHYMSVDHFRNNFMKQEGIPFFVWYLSLKSKHNYFIKHMQENFEVLQSGVPRTARGCLPA